MYIGWLKTLGGHVPYIGWLKTLGGHVHRLVEDTRGTCT